MSRKITSSDTIILIIYFSDGFIKYHLFFQQFKHMPYDSQSNLALFFHTSNDLYLYKKRTPCNSW